MSTNPNRYGAAVIGDEAAAANKAAGLDKVAANRYGPAVLGHAAETAPAEEPDATFDAAGADEALSLTEFRATLTSENTLELFQQETAREGGPRKGALQSLRKTEREGQARGNILEMIDQALDRIGA